MTPAKQPLITKALALLALGHLITDLSQGALPALLPFLKNAFNLTYAQVGTLVLMQNLTSSVIQPIFGYITDRVSLPRLLPVSVFIAGLGMAITGLAGSYYIMLGIIVISGLGIASFHPQASKAAHFVSGNAKGRSMGVFSVGGTLGQSLGSLFMTFLLTLPGGITNTTYFFMPAAVFAIILWLNLKDISPQQPIVSTAAATTTATATAERPPLPVKMIAILLSFIFVRSTINTGLTTYIPLYYVNYLGGGAVFAGYLLSVFLLAGVVGTFVGATLSDRFGRKTIIMGSMAATLPLISLFQFTSGLATVVLVAVTGAVLIASFATTIVLAQEMMPGYVGMASGLTIGFSIGLGGIGATVLGVVADNFGVPAVFTILSVLPLAALGIAYAFPGKLLYRDKTAA